MIRRPPRSTLDRSSAASDVYKRQHRSAVDPVRGDAQVVGHVGGSLARGGEAVDVGDGQPGVVERVEGGIGVQLDLADVGQSAQLGGLRRTCLLYTSPSPRDRTRSRMPSSA